MARMPLSRVLAATATWVAFLATSAGCNATWLNFQDERTEPVSRPVEEKPEPEEVGPTRYAEQDPASPESADAEEPTGEEAQLAHIEATFEQYQARFSNPDGTLAPPPPAQGDVAASPLPSPSPAPPPNLSDAPATRPATADPVPSAERPFPGAPSASQEPGADEVNPSRVLGPNQAVVLDMPAGHAESPSAPPAAPSSLDSPLRVELLDVRPAGPGDAPDPQPASPAPNEPAVMSAEPPGWAAWIAQLQEDVATHPHHFDNQLRLRLLYLAMGQEDKAVRPPEDVDPYRGELLTTLCQVLAATGRAIENPAAAAEALDAVDALDRLVRAQSPVAITKLALVTRVNSFGDYEAIEPPRFTSHTPLHVFCYTEVANFRSEPVDQGQLRTVLSARMEIFQADGKRVWERSIPHIEDRVFTPRRDFFVPLEIQLDAPLSVGQYVLKVTIEDKLGATTDQQRLRFEVGR